jgi:molybdopterin-biosynthesis enzyme MoeA-like protein
MEGVAKAFDRELELSSSIAGRIERAQGKPPNESQLKMAMIPGGACLVDAGDLWFPVVIVENVYVLPGVPELLMKKFESVRERFRGEPFLLKNVYVKRRESEIAASLNELLQEFPALLLGSYPKIGQESFHVLLTLESRDAAYLGRALESLLSRLTADAVFKVE